MGKVNVKSLDTSLATILRSKNRQIMLSQIRNHALFSDFLSGQHTVQVITPTKAFFNAHLSTCGELPDQFILDPQGSRPPVQAGETLLVLFQTQRDAAISQAVVTAVLGSKVRICAVDPRTNIRYKTRLRSLWQPVTAECWKHFNAYTWTVVRQCTPLNVTSSTDWLVRDFVLAVGGQPVEPHLVLGGDGSPRLKGLVTDLSMGGLCMMTANDATVQKLRDEFFFYLELPLPHVTRDFRLGLFAAVRHIRVCEEFAVLHCMFIDKVSPELLVL